MTTPTPPPVPPAVPPPVPPPEPPRGRPPWLPLAVGGGMVAAVVLALFAAGVFSDDEVTAVTTTTNPAVVTTTTQVPATTTTAPATTTTAPPTSTTGATTTTTPPGVLLHDDFEDSTEAQALFGEEYMVVSLPGGRAVIEAVQGPFVLPAMYPGSIGDATITMEFRTNLVNPAARAGLLVWGDDPGDGGLDRYVLVVVDEAEARLVIWPFDGGFGEESEVPLPAAAGFAPDGFNTLVVTLSGGEIAVTLNDVLVTTWDESFPATSGWFGLVVLSGGPGDALAVRDLIVAG